MSTGHARTQNTAQVRSAFDPNPSPRLAGRLAKCLPDSKDAVPFTEAAV